MSEEVQESKEKNDSSKKSEGKIAIIRIRSASRATSKVVDTLKMLRLLNKNACVIYPKTADVVGMVRAIENYVTYGDVDSDTITLLETKRGQKDKDGKLKKFFRLHPPRGGFEKKGIKKPFNLGGALGPRGVKINDLIKKMI